MHLTCENTLIAKFLEFYKKFSFAAKFAARENLPILLRNLKIKIYEEYFGHKKKRFFKQDFIFK